MAKRILSRWPTSNDVKRVVRSPNISKRPELNEYERILIGKGLIPKTFLLKHSTIRVVDLAIAELINENAITTLREPENLEFIIVIPPEEKAPREGRYVKALTPQAYDKMYTGTRKSLTVLAARRDRHLLYYIGNTHIGNGLQRAMQYVRDHIEDVREAFPEITMIGKEGL